MTKKVKHAWLPEGFTIVERKSKNGNQYAYVVFRVYHKGSIVKQHAVCRADLPKSEIFAYIEKFQGKDDINTLNWIVNRYLDSDQFKMLALATRQKYESYAETLLKTPLISGKSFGSAPLKLITPRVIRRYLDKKTAKIMANRHVQFLKTVFNWAMERYEHVIQNPCIRVKLHRQNPRTRYVEDWEYDLVVKLSSPVPYIAIFMEIAYLCRARFTEIAKLKRDSIRNRGIFLKRTKGSKDELTLWTPRLRTAINKAKKFNPGHISPYLIHDKNGLPISYDAFSSSWQRLMVKALKSGLKERFTFHDLKAKGVSDHEHKASGHKSAAMLAVYDRKLDETKATR